MDDNINSKQNTIAKSRIDSAPEKATPDATVIANTATGSAHTGDFKSSQNTLDHLEESLVEPTFPQSTEDFEADSGPSDPTPVPRTRKATVTRADSDRCTRCIVQRRKCDGTKPICSVCKKPGNVVKHCFWPEGRPTRSELLKMMEDEKAKINQMPATVATLDEGDHTLASESTIAEMAAPAAPRLGDGPATFMGGIDDKDTVAMEDLSTDDPKGKGKKRTYATAMGGRDSEDEEDEDNFGASNPDVYNTKDQFGNEVPEFDPEKVPQTSDFVYEPDTDKFLANLMPEVDALWTDFKKDQLRKHKRLVTTKGSKESEIAAIPSTQATAAGITEPDPDEDLTELASNPDIDLSDPWALLNHYKYLERPITPLGDDPFAPRESVPELAVEAAREPAKESAQGPKHDDTFQEDFHLRQAFPEQFEEWDFERELEAIRHNEEGE